MSRLLGGGNRLKLGIFGTNGKGGAQTLVPEAYRPNWPAAVATAQMADAAGFEAIVAYARWKGYGNLPPDHPSGVVLDPFTFAAGIAQATRHAAIFATSHAPTIHPIVAAKMGATIDIISGGRFGLNVVGGWNRPELEMFGAPLREHDERYDHLEEWLTLVERLWREEAEFDFAGRFFQVIRGASMPKPLQRPRPPIMNAGGSGRGMRFAAQHADMCFIILKSDRPEESAPQIAEYKRLAREEYGREVQVWTYAPVVQRATRAEAEAYLHRYAVEFEDTACLDQWTAGLAAETRILDPEKAREFRMRFAAGAGGSILLGTAAEIAAQLQGYAEAGLDGALLTWVDFADGLRRFTAEVMPLLEARGLRQAFKGGS
ncbi:LLM class flavin-dependent oxidoreductase [Siccirubricoccus phaeus]|uniref:LLM class flavin-dependent oxidoreductase n=1 Tax=Siccirubricoccus phaeus TaxID=2595053 RepID=UPI0011F28FA7|nr:LLM class flavin-dependent oxidoreductase [Siccirubricoccus phaeus]